MNTIYEATCFDGTHQLISPATLKSIWQDFDYLPLKKRKDAFLKALACLAYFKNWQEIIQIKYGQDGNQSRELVMTATITTNN